MRPALLCLATLLTSSSPVRADDPVRLREAFPADYQYRVSVRVELAGSLTVPDPKETSPKPVRVTGQSAIEYDERVLTPGKNGGVEKTVRQYRRIEFQRSVGGQPQAGTLRPEVRRLVVLRQEQMEVPFSPDGPLTWNEIDLVRTDVFTPALAGLLPEQAIRAGDGWTATDAVVRELTDLERIDDGKLACKLEEVTTVNGRRYARVGFAGAVRGVNEDGPNRQQLEGYLLFDLESAHVSYLSLQGTSTLLDKEGKPLGQVTGRFTLTRQAHVRSKELADEALRGVALGPDDTNTLLLYDNPELGLRLLHPRSWRIGAGRGPQVTLDEAGGSGLLLTVELTARVPTAAQYLAESQAYFEKQKARARQADAPQRVQAAPREVERFALDVESAGPRVWMDYYILRQPGGGATLAARLAEPERDRLRREVERIAKSITLTAPRKGP